MSRYRIRSATIEIDRQIAEELVLAEKFVLRAIRSCELHDRSAEERSEKLRTRKVARDLKRVLATLSEVGRVANPFAVADTAKAPIEPLKKIPKPKKVETEKKIPAPPPPPPPPRPPVLIEDDPEFEET